MCAYRSVAIDGDLMLTGDKEGYVPPFFPPCVPTAYRSVAIDCDLMLTGDTEGYVSPPPLFSPMCAYRSVAIDGDRMLTGDMEGYVFAWSLQNCIDQTCGPDKLCLRSSYWKEIHKKDRGFLVVEPLRSEYTTPRP